MKTEYTPTARLTIEEIFSWIAKDNTKAAERVVSRIRQTIAMLEEFPMLGHPGDIEGTRELLVRGLPYRVIYTLEDDDLINVVAIIHGRRNYPSDQTAG